MLKNYKGKRIFQEEFREFSLKPDEFCLTVDYFESLALDLGVAVKIYEPYSYYVSKKAFGKPLVVCINEEEKTLKVIGDSTAIGKMKSCLEDGLSENLERIVSLRTEKILKAVEGKKNMNIGK
ncbi:MAG: hypothetical protein KatS3mg001_460 [Candidatus Pacearchaeota archaeon]|nr:MAG: hypothetical protein KatS3mg001_460 [Candidatus Pacearchaeota archaeon]